MAKAKAKDRIVLERSYRATLDEMWQMWTTKEGIEAFWGPDGFRVEVHALDVRAGGGMDYSMIAVSPEMIAFMKSQSAPTATRHHIRFTVVQRHERLVWTSSIDFAGVPAYDVATSVDLSATGDTVKLVITLDPMHDELWTGRMKQGWELELGKLDRALTARAPGASRPRS